MKMRPSRTTKTFSPVASEIRPPVVHMIASSYPASIASTLARQELMYIPVALAAVGIARGS